jgi:7-keto-8-aminopelargonate synthetase-like enzyme
LMGRGIFVQAIRPPTVPVNTARLRFTVMATHTPQDLQGLLSAVRETGQELAVI